MDKDVVCVDKDWNPLSPISPGVAIGLFNPSGKGSNLSTLIHEYAHWLNCDLTTSTSGNDKTDHDKTFRGIHSKLYDVLYPDKEFGAELLNAYRSEDLEVELL